MYPGDFEYAAPATIDEALDLLAGDPDAKLLAGGHSLLPMIKIRLANPSKLVDISRIGELKGINQNGNLTIGAMTTYAEIADADLGAAYGVVAECARNVGDPQVRNCGTLGGSIAHADPAADFPAIVLALGAEMTVRGPGGERTVHADEFFVDMFQSAVKPGEILTSITLPVMPDGHGAAYEKFKNPASGYAVVGVAAMVHRNGDGVSECRIGVTGAGPRAQRARAAEDALKSGASVEDAAAKATDGLDIFGDAYASDEYRAHLVRVLAKRALERAMA